MSIASKDEWKYLANLATIARDKMFEVTDARHFNMLIF